MQWLYVSPEDITQPLNNQFYRYFSKLMIPVQDVYYKMTGAGFLRVATALAIALLVIFVT